MVYDKQSVGPLGPRDASIPSRLGQGRRRAGCSTPCSNVEARQAIDPDPSLQLPIEFLSKVTLAGPSPAPLFQDAELCREGGRGWLLEKVPCPPESPSRLTRGHGLDPGSGATSASRPPRSHTRRNHANAVLMARKSPRFRATSIDRRDRALSGAHLDLYRTFSHPHDGSRSWCCASSTTRQTHMR